MLLCYDGVGSYVREVYALFWPKNEGEAVSVLPVHNARCTTALSLLFGGVCHIME